jgi:hypothetical protein
MELSGFGGLLFDTWLDFGKRFRSLTPMVEVLNKNFSTGGSNKSEDPFFTQAGDQLTEGIFLLAKSTDYPDLMMCQAILSMNNLA